MMVNAGQTGLCYHYSAAWGPFSLPTCVLSPPCWITPASGVHSHPWFRAIASVSSHFYWKGLALVILRHWEEMKSPSLARVTLPFTLRTMICQDKGMGHEVALEFCPKMPCLLIILHPFYFTDWCCVSACACVTYLISFFTVSPLAVDSHWTGTNMSQRLLLQISISWHLAEGLVLHGWMQTGKSLV